MWLGHRRCAPALLRSCAPALLQQRHLAMANPKKKGQARSVQRSLRATALQCERQCAQLRSNAWDLVDGIFFLVTLTTVLGAAAVLVTFVDALWYW